MQRRGPWTRHSGQILAKYRFFSVVSDDVTNPGGQRGTYDWVQAPDMVRVAAVPEGDQVYVVVQHHFLPDRPGMWQLPGGIVEVGEHHRDAAARELAEETGAAAGQWTFMGRSWPLPALTQATVHGWLAEDITPGPAHPERSEADLTVRLVPLADAVDAALDGTFGCTASARLVLALWTTRSMHDWRPRIR